MVTLAMKAITIIAATRYQVNFSMSCVARRVPIILVMLLAPKALERPPPLLFCTTTIKMSKSADHNGQEFRK